MIVKDITNEKFGKLTALRLLKERKCGHAVWECICDCGTVCRAIGGKLRSGKKKSCGCSHYKLPEGIASFHILVNGYKFKCRKKNIKWFLTNNEAMKLFKSNCYYCGTKPNNKKEGTRNNGSFIYNGIDRIDSFKDYSLDNVVPSCKRCNAAKNDMTLKEFSDWTKLIYNNMNNWI